jgi:hypothetical protein
MGRDKEPLYGVRRTDGLGVIVGIRIRLDASKVLHCYDAKIRQKIWKGCCGGMNVCRRDDCGEDEPLIGEEAVGRGGKTKTRC